MIVYDVEYCSVYVGYSVPTCVFVHAQCMLTKTHVIVWCDTVLCVDRNMHWCIDGVLTIHRLNMLMCGCVIIVVCVFEADHVHCDALHIIS